MVSWERLTHSHLDYKKNMAIVVSPLTALMGSMVAKFMQSSAAKVLELFRGRFTEHGVGLCFSGAECG